MSELKATPGPWVRETTAATPNHLDEFVSASDGTPICWAYLQANADLIAAAPEMYDVLDDIIADHGDVPIQLYRERIATVLAKARG